MADACSKMDPIPPPAKKVVISPVVKELDADIICKLPAQEKVKPADPSIICALPVQPKTEPNFKPVKIFKEFACEYPSVDANVMRERQPLPFPEKLHDVIAWTDAFVDRIASLTVAEQKKSFKEKTTLANEIERLREVLAKTEVDLDVSRDEVKAANARTETVKKNLSFITAESQARAQTIKDMEARAAKEAAEEKLLRQQIRELSDELITVKKSKDDLLKEFTKSNKDAAQRWKEEHKHHVEDHNALEKEREHCNAEREAKKAALQELDEARVTAKINLEAKDKTITSLTSELVGLRTQLGEAKKLNTELQGKLDETTAKLAASEKALDKTEKVLVGAGEELLTAKQRINKISEELKAATATIATLTTEVKTITNEKNAATTALNQTRTALDKAQADIEGLKTELQTVKTESAGLQVKLTEAERKNGTMKASMLQAQKEKKDADADKEKEVAHAESRLKEQIASHQTEIDGLRDAAEISPEQLAELRTLEVKAKELESKTKGLETKTKDLQTQLDAASKRIIPNPTKSRVNILSAEYGGTDFTQDVATMKKLAGYAATGVEFKINNDLFHPDPWKGQEKSCSITYQLDGEGAPIHLYQKEYKTLKFKLSK